MLFTNIGEGFALAEVIYDKNGKPYDHRYLDMNPAFEIITGINRSKALGNSYLEIFPKANKIAIEKYYEVAASGQPAHFEAFSPTLNKCLDIYAFSPEKGKFASIFMDITERRQAEESLRESKAQLSAFLEQLPVGLGLADTQGRLLVSNSIFRSFKGNIILSKFSNSWRWRAWGTDGHLLDRSEWPFARAFRGESVNPGLDFLYKTDDGREIWTRVSAAPFNDEAGEIKGAVSVIEDIDRQKRAEEALKKAHDNLEEKVKERTAELEKAYNSLKESERSFAEAQEMAHLGNWEWNITTDKVYWSDEIYRILGLNSQTSEMTSSLLLKYIHPDDQEYVNNSVKKAFDGKRYGIDFRIISTNGEEHIVHSQGQITFDQNNIPIRMKGTVQDITERKKAEDTLAKIEETRIKEIHHRIKNNLQVISSLLDLQAEIFNRLETCNTPEIIEAFKSSQNRIASMALIHEELYQGKGTDNLDFAVYIEKLTQELFSSYKLRNEDISLKLSLEQVYLSMDTAIPLGIIVNELVSNSMKHAFPDVKKGR